MNNNVAIAVGAGVLVTAGVAALGWRKLRDRKSTKPSPESAHAHIEKTKEELKQRRMEREQSALVVTESVQEVVVQPLIEEQPEVVEPVQINEPLAVDLLADKVDQLKVGGEEITSVSRIRVPGVDGVAPMFWTHFERNIRRTDVVVLSKTDFSDKIEAARGYHRCTVDGVAGILHVTRNHVSAVIVVAGEFSGISTSAGRFGGKGLVNLSAEQAKNFLNGR